MPDLMQVRNALENIVAIGRRDGRVWNEEQRHSISALANEMALPEVLLERLPMDGQRKFNT